MGYGVPPERIMLGHVQRNPDLWYHKKIASLGCSFMYDGGYRVKYYPDSTRVELIRGMIAAGYQKHITLGCDAGKKSYQKAYGAGTGFDYDLTVFVPRLPRRGHPGGRHRGHAGQQPGEAVCDSEVMRFPAE